VLPSAVPFATSTRATSTPRAEYLSHISRQDEDRKTTPTNIVRLLVQDVPERPPTFQVDRGHALPGKSQLAANASASAST
jgi:hypothetical protein